MPPTNNSLALPLTQLIYFPNRHHHIRKDLARLLEERGINTQPYFQTAFNPNYQEQGLSKAEREAIKQGTEGSLSKIRAIALREADIPRLHNPHLPDGFFNYLNHLVQLQSPTVPLIGETLGFIDLASENKAFERLLTEFVPMLKIEQLLATHFQAYFPTRLNEDKQQISIKKALGFESSQALGEFIKGKKVLDLGSGTGTFAKGIAALNLAETADIDSVDPMIRVPENLRKINDLNPILADELKRKSTVGRESLINLFKKIDTKTFPHYWADLSFAKDASYDLIVSNRSFPHYSMSIAETKKVFKELFRVLKPGGEIRLGPILEESNGKEDPVHHLNPILDIAYDEGFEQVQKPIQVNIDGDPLRDSSPVAFCVALKKKAIKA